MIADEAQKTAATEGLVPSSDQRITEASGRFDTDFYERCYSESIAEGQPPLDHFLTVGHGQGLLASAHFDPVVYQLRHPNRRHPNPLVDSALNGDDGEYRDIAALFPDVDVDAMPVWIRYRAEVKAEWTANAHIISENVARSVRLRWGGCEYELRNPSPETVLSRLAENRPFSFARLSHGFWDSLFLARRLAARLQDHPRCRPLNRAEVGNAAIRLLARAYLPQDNGIFVENMLHEIESDLLDNPPDEDFWTALSLDGVPTFDDGLYALDAEDVSDRLAVISGFFAPSKILYDAMLWQRWALSGDLPRLAEAARAHPVVMVGPEKFHSLGTKWRLPRFRHVAIAPKLSQLIRHRVLDAAKVAILSAAAEARDVKPIVFFQCGSLAYWLIRRLRVQYPDVFYLDLGQSLDLWYWNPDAALMAFYGDVLSAANPFVVRSTARDKPVSGKAALGASTGLLENVVEILRRDYLDTGLMALPASRDVLTVAGGFQRKGAMGWVVELPSHLEPLTDTNTAHRRSPLILLENGKPSGHGHDSHAAVLNEGGGRYSFWDGWLYFSTSDGSDPNENGRTYSVARIDNPAEQADAEHAGNTAAAAGSDPAADRTSRSLGHQTGDADGKAPSRPSAPGAIPRIVLTRARNIALLYESHARSCDPKDFQGQVMRNPDGKSVGHDQVAMIVDAIGEALDIGTHDVLLDLCCGNGAITDPIFARCQGGLGVDFTPYLIEVAKTNFERPPNRVYRLADVQEYVETTDDTKRFTKALCYGAFQCLSESKAAGLLVALRRRFPNVERMFIGNLPDLDRVGIYYDGNIPSPHDLKRHDTLIGIWRTEQEIAKLAIGCGWCTEFSRMPSAFYGAHYRFDATLTVSAVRGSAAEGAATPPRHEVFTLEPPYHPQGPCGWDTHLPRQLEALTDNSAAPDRSPLVLFEEETELAPAHEVHRLVCEVGRGAYSFWLDTLYFSTSDGSDPNTNGRTYRVFRIGSPVQSPVSIAGNGEPHGVPNEPQAALPANAPAGDAPRPTDIFAPPALPISETALRSMPTLGERSLVQLAGFAPENGFCYIAQVAGPIDGDIDTDPQRSSLRLIEDGVDLGPPHTAHQEIREQGGGRYSHWHDAIYFSTSDNSDPRSNGRTYHAYRAAQLGQSTAASRAIEALRLMPPDYTRQDAYSAIEIAMKALDPQVALGDPYKAFWEDEAFVRDYQRICGDGRRAMERKYAVYQLVKSLAGVPGELAECGTYAGETAYFMALAGREIGREQPLHIFDSFEGLSQPNAFDGSFWHFGQYAIPESRARANLAGFADVRIYKGWIPARFDEVADRQFCFVHVDVDLYQPTRDTLDFFYPRLETGGILLCDDYGSTLCPGARKAMDEFFRDKPEYVIDLPTEQGLIIKR